MKSFHRFVRWLEQRQWLEQIQLTHWQLKKLRYIEPGVYEPISEGWALTDLAQLNEGHGTTYMLRQQAALPEGWQAGEAALLYYGGGEGLLRLGGSPYHGLDNNHWFVPLPKSYQPGDELDMEIELYDPIPEPVDPLNRQSRQKPPISGVSVSLVQVNWPVYELLHTVRAVQEAAALLSEGSLQRSRLVEALEAAIASLYEPGGDSSINPSACRHAEAELRKAAEDAQQAYGNNGTMHMVGQSHIDIAWLWPIKETVRKASRTFSTICALMDRYPDFYYAQSQPILYAFVKQNYPELYENIKMRIAEGRWELVGGMWVEPDLNIPSGESLVRQILIGQRFYEEEFGRRSTIEWLPDTFGYCASLPQLLKQAGIDYFMTTKLGWNDTNEFPHTLFNWVGIDGTSIVAYQNHGLNEHTRPQDVQEHWQDYKEKDRHDELMLLYGHGDGGGGVTHEMLEYIERSACIPGQPQAKYSTARQFFDGIRSSGIKLPNWHGDLYLELHRGTYTTHAKNKRSNRQAEQLYRAAEVWLSLSGMQDPQHQSQAGKRLEEGWKLLLLNQFHDIIPGTSIPEVYETSAKQYEEIMRLGNAALEEAMGMLAGRMQTESEEAAYVAFNSLGWARDGMVYIPLQPGMEQLAAYDANGELPCRLEAPLQPGEAGQLAVQTGTIPAFGCKTFWLRPVKGVPQAVRSDVEPYIVQHIAERSGQADKPPTGSKGIGVFETDYYTIELDAQGLISRLYDKNCDRELLQAGRLGNELQLFHDTPLLWDAWDIAPDYESKRADAQQLMGWRMLEHNMDRIVIELNWQLSQSWIRQQMIIPIHDRCIEFRTYVDWQENHKLLKVAFPLGMVSGKATYEIPFGALERTTHRNTSWEQAQYEVCGHRWADLSEHGYGVSLLNDCKYGYDIKDAVLRLSLLRAPSWPDAAADRGEHVFTYALYPHEGSWQQAQTVRVAAGLNEPLRAIKANSASNTDTASDTVKESLGFEHSWIDLASDQVILDTVKPAEDGSGIVLRLYEAAGGRSEAVIGLSGKLLAAGERFAAAEVNILEDRLADLTMSGGRLRLSFNPFEIKTIKITTSL
ncbi:alpha-mannosidase [Paenibacillus algorifonticola]|uniref:alpha-mannosidase n=1 Tax=Paenibacillus algorifonticola TaxID=684063 RepID=A0A1I2GKI7_9BACL|nr:alpha-mannosidase [Paenibacillus algorifonticola]SFF17758.1 alpha-mannosidase [Paenibacillus algorifonticola]